MMFIDIDANNNEDEPVTVTVNINNVFFERGHDRALLFISGAKENYLKQPGMYQSFKNKVADYWVSFYEYNRIRRLMALPIYHRRDCVSGYDGKCTCESENIVSLERKRFEDLKTKEEKYYQQNPPVITFIEEGEDDQKSTD